MPPVVLFQNNHVLAVHKPPGWHSIPHTDGDNLLDTSKCLLTYLCEQKLGGGSQNEYLKPLHRIDQPCSGLLLFGKTTKAASRIQALFNKMSKSTSSEDGTADTVLQKTYYVLVHSSATEPQFIDPGAWQTLHGGVVPRNHRDSRRHHTTSPQKGWSVPMIPLEEEHGSTTSDRKPRRTILRLCSLRYRPVLTYTSPNAHNNHHMKLLQVQTAQGARHLIRALLSCHGRIVVGDLRYGDKGPPLPDQSVALHARSLQFPPSFQLVKDGHLTAAYSPLPRILKGPVPASWETYFRCTQAMIDAWEEEYVI
jgi:23S rRNA-/tRNA-specific pseudouridylate synthase